MDTYTLSSIILTLAVIIGYLNHRFIQMQSTIAIMTAALGLSAILLILQHFGIANIAIKTEAIVANINFPDLLLKGMLSFLLFAGALTIDFSSLKDQKWEIGILSSLSTIVSALIVGILVYYLLPLLSIHLPLLYCLLFGALISPTDPIAVLATFKKIGVPKALKVCVAGESLFNDGVGIVIFATLYALTFNGTPITFEQVSLLFLKQAVGGIAYGLLLGYVTNWLIKSINDHRIAILLTLGAVTGGYAFALWLGISGPLAMVVTGILVGNKNIHKKQTKMSESLDIFWEVIDEILNAVLFLLIGFELLNIQASGLQIIAILGAIPLVLFVRLLTVAIPMKLIQLRRQHNPYTIAILTWGGLRGGLAVALALSLPPSDYRNFILAMTYGVVAFAVIVQGLSIKPLAHLSKQ
ncbi:cation:proton antiporter [Candidiatus Paracoxiella cheracis]|uniref:cation:proton antiporter n=1 Tax=Candidiatus Paracoxiella cheracis TaxID=3405120 RepID=UPI003BF579FE